MNETRRLKLAELGVVLGVVPDVFLCCASFEARSMSVPRALAHLRIADSIVFANTESAESVASFEYLATLLGPRGRHVQLALSDPLRCADALYGAVLHTVSSHGRHYLVDITTFTHELLLVLMRVLQLVLSDKDRVHLVYTTAAEYSVGDEPGSKWLTKGIGEIRSVLGFPGMMLPARKLHLVVLSGFEGERAERVIDQFEPDRISVGVGAPESSITSDHYQINQALQSRLAAKYPAVELFTFSPSDAFQTQQAVLRQAGRFPNHNVAVAAMNTKVSTVGAALAALGDDSIQLCYATAHQYNVANYSSPGEDCILFAVTLKTPVG